MRIQAQLVKQMAAAIVAGGVALALGLAAVRSESRLAIAERRSDTQQAVELVGARIEHELLTVFEQVDELADGSGRNSQAEWRAALEAVPYPIWRVRGGELTRLSGAEDLPLTAGALLTATTPLVGPVTAATGEQLLLLQTPVYGSGDGRAAERIAAVVKLDELWRRTGLAELLRAGIDVRVSREDSSQQPLYWSSPQLLQSPASTRLALPDQDWRLDVAPRGGWRDAGTTWSRVVVVWVAALGYALTYMLMSRRPSTLQEELAYAQRRLDDKTAEMAALLKSRSQLETQLVSSLTLDVHTGLPNRDTFLEHLQGRLAQSRLMARGTTLVAVLRFRQFDELANSIGSTFAQRFLSQAADRLLRSVAAGRYVARVGEKDLAVCVDVETQDAPPVLAEALAEGLLGALDERFTIGKQQMFPRATVGLAACTDGYEHATELLAKATLAAEAAGRAQERWALFEPGAKEERVSLLQLEADLQTAIDEHQLRMHFQPIVSVAEGAIVGFESLLRWQHPIEGFIPPDKFLPLAETMGQMPRITEWCARECVAHAKQWQRALRQPLYLTLNLSPQSLSPAFVAHLFDLLAEHELPPEYLRIEITETAVVRDFRAAARVIADLSDRGVRVLLDDFGTGYSSLSYLRELPFHAVKIDKSFIRNMSIEARDFGLVRSIVNLVHYLGMECVAEGVETSEQLDLVEMIGCDSWQGFLYSKPVPAAEVDALVTRPSGRRQAAGA